MKTISMISMCFPTMFGLQSFFYKKAFIFNHTYNQNEGSLAEHKPKWNALYNLASVISLCYHL